MSTNYLKNATLLAEIVKSKWTYCWFENQGAKDYSVIAETVAEAAEQPVGTIVRVHTYRHIPASDVRNRSRDFDGKGREMVNFRPFSHYRVTTNGLVEVARSHWRGDLVTGHFSATHGRLTDRLGAGLMLLCERYTSRSNLRGYSYRDEIEHDALCQLVAVALKFDETRGDNPFSFYTTCATNAARRTLTAEKKAQNIADDLRIMGGLAPSMTRQTEMELARFEPVKLAAKRGRKPRASSPPGSVSFR